MNKRNINIELIRIISMLMIVYHHFSVHTTWDFPNQIGFRNYLILSIGNFGKGGVLLFILITGYFFSKQNVTYKKIFNLNKTITFYSVTFFIISLLWLPFSIKTLIQSLLPVIFDQYWFVTSYVLLLLFQPILKKYLCETPREKKLKNGVLLAAFTYIPAFLGFIFQIDRYFTSNNILVFLIAALTGDLLREYQAELRTKYFKQIIAGFIFSVFLLQFRPFLIEFLLKNQLAYPDFLINETKSFNSLLFSTTLFIIILNLKVPKKLSTSILFISTCTFEVYLIHDNPLFRNYLWNNLLNNSAYYWSNYLPIIVLIEPILIFLCCILIIKIRHFFINKLSIKKSK